MFSLVVWLGSTPPAFYFRVPPYPHTGSSLMCFGCCRFYHKLPDCFVILTFSPSSFCETSALPFCWDAARCRLTMTSADFCRYGDVILCSNTPFRVDILACLCRIIRRSLGVSISAFHSCSLCIYAVVLCTVKGFCLFGNITRTTTPHMQFLFVGSNVCRQLPSDSTSRWTPLLLANTPYCKAYSGLAPYSRYTCPAHIRR